MFLVLQGREYLTNATFSVHCGIAPKILQTLGYRQLEMAGLDFLQVAACLSYQMCLAISMACLQMQAHSLSAYLA